jgi:hypothetical protein
MGTSKILNEHMVYTMYRIGGHRVRVMVFNTTFNNISVITWQSVLLVEETRVPPKKNTDKLYHKMLYQYTSPLARFEIRTLVVIGTDCIGSCKSKLQYDHDHDRP